MKIFAISSEVESENINTEKLQQHIEKYSCRVYNIAFRLLDSREEAKDLVQTVYASAVASMGVQKELNHLEMSAYRLVVELCAARLLIKQAAERQALGCDRRPTMGLTKNSDCIGYTREMVIDALACLTCKHKIFIVLKDIQGFNYGEISKIINIPVEVAIQEVKAARKVMKSSIAGNICNAAKEMPYGYSVL